MVIAKPFRKGLVTKEIISAYAATVLNAGEHLSEGTLTSQLNYAGNAK